MMEEALVQNGKIQSNSFRCFRLGSLLIEIAYAGKSLSRRWVDQKKNDWERS